MLKFRFRKQNLRRRSNSCPHLERDRTEEKVNFEQNAEPIGDAVPTHSESESMESGSENESESLPWRERLKFQRSIRRAKKKEKEQQDNFEKNLLSMDDYYGKLTSLKEWLCEEGKKDVMKITSPKMKSHFKTFIKLWNKRKLPTKYYRSCCIDTIESSSNPDDPSSPSVVVPHLYAGTSNLPTYHRFPPVDEPDTPWKPVFSSPRCLKLRTMPDDSQSPFSTFGKSLEDSESTQSFLSYQALHSTISSQSGSARKPIDGVSSQMSKANGPVSPSKFATISRSMPASTLLKPLSAPLSPRVHPVLSPTCPLVSCTTKTLPNSFSFGPQMNSQTEDRHSPAYICPKDSIRYESPEYEHIGEFFKNSNELAYTSLSSFYNSGTKDLPTHGQRTKPKLNRRRSKSMEDIYAVPDRLRAKNPQTFSPIVIKEDLFDKTPPVPEKKFDLCEPKGDQHISSFSVPDPQNRLGWSIHNSISSKVESKDIRNTSQELENGPTAFGMGNSQFSESIPSKKMIPNLESFTKTHFHLSLPLPKPGLKRRSQDEEGFEEESSESSKKVNSTKATPLTSSSKKPSILTGSRNPTTRTPVSELVAKTTKKDETRLSILHIKQLDSSPTFPRRRIKRRSSNLTVTPGKSLTFGNKTPTFAKPSPKRVSFAKDVNDTEKNSTPRRKSASKQIAVGQEGRKDIRRQSQDKVEFESFWSSHSPVRGKNQSPEQRSPAKVWSPPKWLSPSKQQPKVSTAQSPDRKLSKIVTVRGKNQSPEQRSPAKVWSPPKWLSPSKQQPKVSTAQSPDRKLSKIVPGKHTLSPSKKGAELSERGSPSKEVSHPERSNGIREGFSFRVSPSKIVSRLIRNISSSSLVKENESSSESDNSKGHPIEENSISPKSILKNKDQGRFFQSSTPSPQLENKTFPARQVGRRLLGPPSSNFHVHRNNGCQHPNVTTKTMTFNFSTTKDCQKLNSKPDQIPGLAQNLYDKNRFFDNAMSSSLGSHHILKDRNDTIKDFSKESSTSSCSNITRNLNSGPGKKSTKEYTITDNLCDQVSVRRNLYKADFYDQSFENSHASQTFSNNDVLYASTHQISQKLPPIIPSSLPDDMVTPNENGVNKYTVFAHDGDSVFKDNAIERDGDEDRYIWNHSDHQMDNWSTDAFSDKSDVGLSNESIEAVPLKQDKDEGISVGSRQTSLDESLSLQSKETDIFDSPGASIQHPNEPECREECKLGRLESMKASPNIVENDSWITARRKSSLRHKRIASPSFSSPESRQLLNAHPIEGENIFSKTLSKEWNCHSQALSAIKGQERKDMFDVISSSGSNENSSHMNSIAEISHPHASKVDNSSQNNMPASDNDQDVFSCLIIDYVNGKSSNTESSKTAKISSTSRLQMESESESSNSGKSNFVEIEIAQEDREVNSAARVSTKPKPTTQNINVKEESDKENEENMSTACSPKYLKPRPKPAIRPKPSLRSKPNASSPQGKLMNGNNTANSRPTVRKRSSLLKKESVTSLRNSSSFKNSPQKNSSSFKSSPQKNSSSLKSSPERNSSLLKSSTHRNSSSFKSNTQRNSSLLKSSTLRNSSSFNSPKSNSSSFKSSTQRNSSSFKSSTLSSSSVASKRNISTAPKSVELSQNVNLSSQRTQERRTSVTQKKRRSQSNAPPEGGHPHITSFAQRRKFFQQIVESSPCPTPTGKVPQLTQSVSGARIRPRPPVKPKPRLSKIGLSNKGLTHQGS